MATFSGAALGAATGGIIEALRSLDIPEEEARHYQKELEAGHVVITVQAQSGYADALQILRRNGAHDVATPLAKSTLTRRSGRLVRQNRRTQDPLHLSGDIGTDGDQKDALLLCLARRKGHSSSRFGL